MEVVRVLESHFEKYFDLFLLILELISLKYIFMGYS